VSQPASPSKITVVAAELEQAATWAGSDRPHLHVVAFRGDEYVATDGHRMIRVPCKTHDHVFGIERDHVASAIAAFRRMHRLERFIDLVVSPLSKDVEFHIGPESARHLVRVSVPRRDLDVLGFPNKAQVDGIPFPRNDPRSASDTIVGHWLNPAYMKAVADFHAISGDEGEGKYGVEVVSYAKDRLGPVELRNANGVRFLIMPIRGK